MCVKIRNVSITKAINQDIHSLIKFLNLLKNVLFLKDKRLNSMIRWLLCKIGIHEWVWRKENKHPHCCYCGKIDYDHKPFEYYA